MLVRETLFPSGLICEICGICGLKFGLLPRKRDRAVGGSAIKQNESNEEESC